jgi:hypothetical protein
MSGSVSNALEWAATQIQRIRVRRQFRRHMGVGDRIYFGELTCTPHQGYGLIKEPRRQRMRDEMWQLDAYNPRLYDAPAAYGRGIHPNRRSFHGDPAIRRTDPVTGP